MSEPTLTFTGGAFGTNVWVTPPGVAVDDVDDWRQLAHINVNAPAGNSVTRPAAYRALAAALIQQAEIDEAEQETQS